MGAYSKVCVLVNLHEGDLLFGSQNASLSIAKLLTREIHVPSFQAYPSSLHVDDV